MADKTKDVYKVIRNPSRYINKHEVWISGMHSQPLQDASGNVAEIKTKHAVRCIAAFHKPESAQEYIDYQLAVAEFRGTSDDV